MVGGAETPPHSPLYARLNKWVTPEHGCTQRLVVCLEESLYIHNIRDMKVLHTIRDTPPNPAGICAVSVNNDNCYLAYPGSSRVGEVQIFDTVNLVSSLVCFYMIKLFLLSFV